MSSAELIAAGPEEPRTNNSSFGFGWHAEQYGEPLGGGGMHDNLATDANSDVLLDSAEGTEDFKAWL